MEIDQYLEDIQIGIFEAKVKKTEKNFDDIANEIIDQIDDAISNPDEWDWESEAEQIIDDDYKLNKKDKKKLMEILFDKVVDLQAM